MYAANLINFVSFVKVLSFFNYFLSCQHCYFVKKILLSSFTSQITFLYRFSTSRQTLTWIPDTFFTALLSGRISSLRDETGAIFIDRDPSLFSIILNYLRTKEINVKESDIRALRHESEYYGLTPLVKRLGLCMDLNHSTCGDVLFYGFLPAPAIPPNDHLHINQQQNSFARSENNCVSNSTAGLNQQQALEQCLPSTSSGASNARPGSMVRVPEPANVVSNRHSSHSRNSSWDLRLGRGSNVTTQDSGRCWSSSSRSAAGEQHSRNSSIDFKRHSRNSSADLNKVIANDVGLVFSPTLTSNWVDPLRVQIIKAHQNWFAVAYAHFVACYR